MKISEIYVFARRRLLAALGGGAGVGSETDDELRKLLETGALQKMARAYGIPLDDAEARRVVDVWRRAVPGAREDPWVVPGDRDAADRVQ